MSSVLPANRLFGRALRHIPISEKATGLALLLCLGMLTSISAAPTVAPSATAGSPAAPIATAAASAAAANGAAVPPTGGGAATAADAVTAAPTVATTSAGELGAGDLAAGDLAAGVLAAGDLAARLRARLQYDPLTGYGLFEKAGNRLVFAQGLPRGIFDWNRTIPLDPPKAGEGGLVFSAASSAQIEKAFGDAEALTRSRFSVAAILIDPGHGGKDPGAIGELSAAGKKMRVVEKDVTLAVSQKLYAALKAKYPDKRILVTRADDSYPSLEDRVELANSVELEANEAIIYVSIHANSSFNKNAKGFEIWYLNPEYRRTLVDANKPGSPGQEIAPILNAMLEEEFTTESIILARDVMSGLQTRIGSESPNRGVRAEEWFVVRNAHMPSILVETGFVTNPEEGKLLTQDDYLSRVADGVYTGLVDFVGYFESMRGAPSP